MIGTMLGLSLNLQSVVIGRSNAGNLKLTQGETSVLLSPADLLAMGFADEASFLTFINDAKVDCCADNGAITPPILRTVTVPMPIFNNAESHIEDFAVPGILHGGNNNIVLATDLTLYPEFIVDWKIRSNGFIHIEVVYEGGNDNVTLPDLLFNIYTQP
jgi:hypothetical protein